MGFCNPDLGFFLAIFEVYVDSMKTLENCLKRLIVDIIVNTGVHNCVNYFFSILWCNEWMGIFALVSEMAHIISQKP